MGAMQKFTMGQFSFSPFPSKFLTLFSSSRPFSNFSFNSCGLHCIGTPKCPKFKGFQPAERPMLSHQYGGLPYIAIVWISITHWHLGSLSPVSWRKVTNDWTEQCAIVDHVVMIIRYLWRRTIHSFQNFDPLYNFLLKFGIFLKLFNTISMYCLFPRQIKASYVERQRDYFVSDKFIRIFCTRGRCKNRKVLIIAIGEQKQHRWLGRISFRISFLLYEYLVQSNVISVSVTTRRNNVKSYTFSSILTKNGTISNISMLILFISVIF